MQPSPWKHYGACRFIVMREDVCIICISNFMLEFITIGHKFHFEKVLSTRFARLHSVRIWQTSWGTCDEICILHSNDIRVAFAQWVVATQTRQCRRKYIVLLRNFPNIFFVANIIPPKSIAFTPNTSSIQWQKITSLLHLSFDFLKTSKYRKSSRK